MTAALAVFAMAGPSWADDGDWNHGHKHHDDGWEYYGRHYPAYVYAPPPRYYGPPRYVYAPPPPRYYYYAPSPRVIYAPPPPVYVYPQSGIQVVVPLHID